MISRLTEKDEQGNWCVKDLPWRDLHVGQAITQETWERLYGCLYKLMEYEETGLSPEDVVSLNDFEQTQTAHLLRRLGEEQRKHQWILVTERLPELEKTVLVHQVYSWERFEDGAQVTIGRLHVSRKGQEPYWQYQHYRPDFKSGTIMDNDIICPGNEYVVAWMPLPEPYREDIE